MPEPSLHDLQARLLRLESNVEQVAATVKDVAEALHRQSLKMQEKLETDLTRIRDSIEERAARERVRTLSVYAVLLPVILAAFGYLQAGVNKNADRVDKHNEAHFALERSIGRLEGN